MNKPEPHITVKDLTMAYGSYVLQRDLTFTVNRGDVFIIMGGSGCGKSTLMRHLIGLKEPARGQVLYGAMDFWGSEPDERDRMMRRFGVMYQSGALWSSLTLAENIALSLELYTKLKPAQIREIASLKLALVGLAGFEDYYPVRDQRRDEKTGRNCQGHGPRPGDPVLRRALGGSRPGQRTTAGRPDPGTAGTASAPRWWS